MTTNIFDAFDEQSQTLLQGLKMIDFEGLQNSFFKDKNTLAPENPLLFKTYNSSQIAINNNYKTIINEEQLKVYTDPENNFPIQTLKEVILYENRFERDIDDLKIVLFLSSNGAGILKQYEEVEPTREELILFIETNDKNNLFGSVLRMKAGSDVTNKKDLPFKDIFAFSKEKQTNISNNELKNLIEKGLYQTKPTLFSWVINAFTKALDEIFSFFKDDVLGGIGDVFGKTLADGILSLKIDENRWNPNPKDGEYNPLFLPSNFKERIGDTLADTNFKKTENILSEYLKPFVKKLDAVEKFFKGKLESIKKYFPKIIYKKLKSVLDFLFNQLQNAKSFLQDPLTGLQRLIFKYAQAANALLCGIINSLIDIFAGFFQIIGFVFNGLADLTDLITRADYYGVLFAETMENIIETIRKVDFLDLIKQAAIFQIKFAVNIYNYIKKGLDITIEELSYYYGYIMGIIIETAAEIFFTAGSATVAKWSAKMGKLLQENMGKIATVIKNSINFAKGKLHQVLDFINFIISRLKKGAKYLFKELSKLIDEIFGVGKKVEELPKTPSEKRVLEKREAQAKRLEEKKNRLERIKKRRELDKKFRKVNEKVVKLYRVQGGEIPNASRYRFFKKSNKVFIEGKERLYVTFKDEDRVLEFWIKRGDKAEVFTADISESFFNRLMKDAVPQEYGKAFPTRPQFGDATKTAFSLGVPENYFDELLDNLSNVEILKFK